MDGMTIHSSLVEHIGRRRLDQVWTRHGRRFCRFTSSMLVTTVDQPRRGTLVWSLRSSCDKHHARTETRGTQGDRRTTLWPVRLADWLPHLADQADLGDLRTKGWFWRWGGYWHYVTKSARLYSVVYTHRRLSSSTSLSGMT